VCVCVCVCVRACVRERERDRERERHRGHLLRIVLQHFAERWRPLRGMPRPSTRDACVRLRAVASGCEKDLLKKGASLLQMMMVLFIVLFQKQTSYTFGKGTYFRPRDVTKIPG